MDNRERLALAEKVQIDIQKRTLNYRLLRRREKIEQEFERAPTPSEIADVLDLDSEEVGDTIKLTVKLV